MQDILNISKKCTNNVYIKDMYKKRKYKRKNIKIA